MKNWKKIYIITASVVILFSLLYVLFMLSAKAIIANKIEQAFGSKTSIEKLEIKPPLNIEIKNFEIEDLIKAEYIYLSPSIPSLLSGKIAFNKIRIINPQATYKRTASVEPAKDNLVSDAEIAPIVESHPAIKDTKQGKGIPVIIKSLKIKSGKLNFIDSSASSGVINFTVKDIEFYLTDFSTGGASPVSNFILKGNISWNTGEPDGKISFQGWMDRGKKDMFADLKIEDIDAIVFYPYYSTWVDLEKARIEKAKLNFNSKIQGKNNNVTAQCRLELTDIVRKVRSPEESQEKAELLTDAVLEMFKTMDQGKVVLNFTLNTKMDRPIFGFGDIKQAFEGKLMQGKASAGLRPQDMLLWPGKMLQSGFRSGANLSNAALDGAFALGNGIKKFFEDMVNNQPVPTQ